MLLLDGSMGEGGGQVLRSALSLSLLTGKAFTMSHIRARRSKPGLRPQHLAAVQAAAQICGARVEGDRQGSEHIVFSPGPVRAGDYHFDIGTAGATALVLQTLLVPLALAHGPSRLTISGGTHVPLSPCYHYLAWHWVPLLARLGIHVELSLKLAGFLPQGGGEIEAKIPGNAHVKEMNLSRRGNLLRVRGLSAIANLPWHIAERQRDQAMRRLHEILPVLEVEIATEAFTSHSTGTVLLLLAEFEQGQACFFALGARGKPAERVADEAVHALASFLHSDGAVDPWLADQLLVPLAVAHGPSVLRTSEVTSHLLTNAEVIGSFLPVSIVVDGAMGAAADIHIRP